MHKREISMKKLAEAKATDLLIIYYYIGVLYLIKD